jgi:hypothetical protein
VLDVAVWSRGVEGELLEQGFVDAVIARPAGGDGVKASPTLKVWLVPSSVVRMTRPARMLRQRSRGS